MTPSDGSAATVAYPTRAARRYDVVSFGEAMVRLTPSIGPLQP